MNPHDIQDFPINTMFEAVAEGFVSYHLLFSIVLEAPYAIIITDGRRILTVNRAAMLWFGYHDSELLRQPIEMLIPPEVRERHAQHQKEYLHHPRHRSLGKLRALCKNGTTISVETELSAFMEKEGLRVVVRMYRYDEE